jgi:hypothetical protein
METQYLSQQALQSELLPGETLLWTGQPSSRVIFHKEDLFLIPFSLMWGGFAIFWELGVTGSFGQLRTAPFFFTLWGIPFVVIGQYLIWGRFIYSAWKKRKIVYGLTARRVLILDTAWKRSLQATYIDQIPVIEKTLRSDGIGTLRFGYPPPQTGRGYNSRSVSNWDGLGTGGVPSFVDIEDAEGVYSMVANLRGK